jgi:hypothetical protein
MRVRLKSINSLTTTLADGTVKTYWYAWKGGPRINAEPGTPEFVRLYSEAVTAKMKKSAGTFRSLIDYFKDQSEYTSLGDKSKRAYDQYLKLIDAKFGSMPVGALEDRRARGDFKAFRNSFADKPRKADYIWTTIARVLSVAKDHGKISVNVCERGGRLYDPDRSEIVWTSDDIREFCSVASVELQAAMLLALWTGQRQGDLLRLTWKSYDGKYIHLRQSKARRGKGAGDDPRRFSAQSCPRCGAEGEAIRGNHPDQLARRAVDRGRLPDKLGQGVQEDVAERPALPRFARDCCHTPRIVELLGTGDRLDHRTLDGNGAADPRRALPWWSRRACGVSDQEAQRGLWTGAEMRFGMSTDSR